MGLPNYASLSTEKVNPRSRKLDRLSPLGIVQLMNREDKQVLRAVKQAAPQLARAIRLIERSFRSGGRLIIVGAGTSGRLGVIEAAECPPTFGTSPTMVQAVMAGGKSAVFKSKEGAEDSSALGASAMRTLRVGARDTVIGIAASGVTAFARTALKIARSCKASTILLTCSAKPPQGLAKLVISLKTGPEVLAGSTRLKAGSACKMALNILTTGSMAQLGKMYGNRMVDLQPKSIKLRDRALRLIQELGRVNRLSAERLFRDAKGHAKTGIVMARLNISYTQAQEQLRKSRGFLRKIL